jgi:ATP-dependent helicase HepA
VSRAKRTTQPFVESSENRIGIGKLVELNGGTATVDYFRSPVDKEPIKEIVRTESLSRVLLPLETRVYYRNPATHVIEVGRVLDYQKHDELYLIRFPNSKSRLIASDDLQVRCRLPITEPTDHLASQVNETAFWHPARAEFVQHLLQQHQISLGLTALLSSSVEIVAHQASAIHRVLTDPFQRYLLADEVGLGKTIEAGVLIKQFALDEPHNHQTIVIVPDALIFQWRQELIHRFHLGRMLDNAIHVVSVRNRDSIAALTPSARMIVIDEAHHLSSWAWSNNADEKATFDLVKNATDRLDRRVLLLSATPVLHNERSFLAMLHLLDPHVYPLDSVDFFKERVRLRQEIAERMADLREDESNFFLGDTLEVLSGLLSEDNEFQELGRQLSALIGEGVDEHDPRRIRLIQSIRTHVSDMWRLHRRILRSRRTESTSVYLPGRGGVRIAVYNCDNEQALANAIDAWRLTLSSALFSASNAEKDRARELARKMAELAVCEPRHVLALATDRLNTGYSASVSSLPLCDGEVDSLRQIIRAAKDCDQLTKLHALLQLIGDGDNAVSYVIFANTVETADLIFEFLELRLSAGSVLRHSSTDQKWTQFKSVHRGYVLVCDRSAEEGLNLQKRGACAIHYDLPFSPNRIEQRMGRLDRFGVGMPVQSAVLVCGGSHIHKRWFELLDTALKVFNRSIASLQYVIEESMRRVWAEFLDAGADAFTDACDRLGGDDGVVSVEFKRVRAQDELDAYDIDQFTQELADDLESNDRKLSREAPRVFTNWAICNLRFRRTGEERSRDEVFTYEFTRRIDVGRRPYGTDTLMPVDDFRRLFRDSIDDVEVQLPIRFITVPFTFDRVAAQKRSCRLLRVGDPFVDAFETFTRWDDRGVSYAFWRFMPSYHSVDDPTVFFRFDYVVSPNPDPLYDLCNRYSGASCNALFRRSRAIMRPLFATIWLDADLELVKPNDERRKMLDPCYSKHRMLNWQDFNLNRDRWNVVATVYDMALWRDRCFAARERSEKILRELSRLPELSQKCVVAATRQGDEVQQQYRSRMAIARETITTSLESDLAFERAFLDAQIDSFRYPELRVDSVGAVFLSRKMPFFQQEDEEDDE